MIFWKTPIYKYRYFLQQYRFFCDVFKTKHVKLLGKDFKTCLVDIGTSGTCCLQGRLSVFDYNGTQVKIRNYIIQWFTVDCYLLSIGFVDGDRDGSEYILKLLHVDRICRWGQGWIRIRIYVTVVTWCP